MSAECRHEKVVRREDGTWHCDLCEWEFYRIPVSPHELWNSPGIEFAREISLEEAQRLKESMEGYHSKIQFTPMPEVATLRDQFAMAAMIADSIQSAVVAAAYIGQGKVMRGDFPGPEMGAKDYYATADSMLEARK